MNSKKPRSEVGWNQCKRVLKSWPQSGMLGLVQELYKLSDDNRRFLHGRLLPQETAMNLAAAAKVLRGMLSSSSVFHNHFRHIEAKRVVDQFEKAVDDPALVADLLLIDLTETLERFAEFGGGEDLVDHAYASMERLEKCLNLLDASQAAPLIEKLTKLANHWSGEFGYGLSDELAGLAQHFNEYLRGRFN